MNEESDRETKIDDVIDDVMKILSKYDVTVEETMAVLVEIMFLALSSFSDHRLGQMLAGGAFAQVVEQLYEESQGKLEDEMEPPPSQPQRSN